MIIHDAWHLVAARGDLSIADLKAAPANVPVIDKTIRDAALNFSLAEWAGIDLVTRFGISGFYTVASWKCLTASGLAAIGIFCSCAYRVRSWLSRPLLRSLPDLFFAVPNGNLQPA